MKAIKTNNTDNTTFLGTNGLSKPSFYWVIKYEQGTIKDSTKRGVESHYKRLERLNLLDNLSNG